MSGYRAAPKGSHVVVPMPRGDALTLKRATSESANKDGGDWEEDGFAYFDEWEADAVCDALYWSRRDALESAAQACEAMGATDAAGAIRKMNGTQ